MRNDLVVGDDMATRGTLSETRPDMEECASEACRLCGAPETHAGRPYGLDEYGSPTVTIYCDKCGGAYEE